MKNLLLVAGLGLLGYFAYLQWLPAVKPVQVVEAAPAPSPTPTPVDFAIRSSVRSLYEEWKRRELSRPYPHGAAAVDMATKLSDIRRRLFSQGLHSEEAMKRTMASALRELGVAEEETGFVVDKILEEIKVDSVAALPAAGGAIPAIPQLPPVNGQ